MKRVGITFVVMSALSLPAFAHDAYVDTKACTQRYGDLNRAIYYAWATTTEEGKKHAEKTLHERKGKSSNQKLKEFQSKLTEWKNKSNEERMNEIKNLNDLVTACFTKGSSP